MQTPIYAEHLRLGAKMTQFAGWEMPLYYSSIVDETAAVRQAAGLFDLSHMGEIIVSGPSAIDLLQFVTTNDVSRLDIGQAQYTLLCNESGGILDDLVVYRLDEQTYMPVVNASNAPSDFQWILQHNNFGAEVQNRSEETGLIAVQGPRAMELLQPITSFDISAMRRFRVQQGRVGEISAWIASTGYTGGPGYELYCSSEDAPVLWRLILDAGKSVGARPAGLGARDVLRVEAGLALYGNEITAEITPVEAGLMWVVKLDKPDFIGKQAIEKAKARRADGKLTGLIAIDRCIPRHGYEITSRGEPVGVVTSGTFSPTLEKGIAMGYVKTDLAQEGTRLEIQVRGKPCAVQVVKLPFYKPS